MSTKRNHALRILLTAFGYLALSGYSSCDPIITNNGFDLWCGDSLCDWDLEAGAIRKVPTWHEADRGIEMSKGDVAFSQASDISAADTRCLRFDIVANIGASSVLYLEADFHDDGTVDFQRTVPGNNWEPSSYLMGLPPYYNGIRFRLRKEGSDTAVIAQLQADTSEACKDYPESPLAPLGASCVVSEQCESGYCTGAACHECTLLVPPGHELYCASCSFVEPDTPGVEPHYACLE